MNTKAKVVPLLVIVAVLVAVVIVFRSLTVLSTALLIGAGAFAFLHRDEASDSRKLPWQTWLLSVVSVVLYLVDWLVLGN
jgi:positive regulator of sigma E activity